MVSRSPYGNAGRRGAARESSEKLLQRIVRDDRGCGLWRLVGRRHDQHLGLNVGLNLGLGHDIRDDRTRLAELRPAAPAAGSHDALGARLTRGLTDRHRGFA
jgi:hypothetical protein